MKKLHSVLAVLTLIVIMCSCINSGSGEKNTPSGTNSASASSESEFFASEQLDVKCISDEETVSDAVIVDKNQAVLLIESEMEMLTVSPKRIVLYDFSKDKVLNETALTCARPDLFEYKQGVYVIGYGHALSLSNPLLVAFDKQLNETYTADFSQLKSTIKPAKVRLSYDGEKIGILTENSSIYLAEIDSIKDAELLFFAEENQNVNRIIDIDFTESADLICYTCKIGKENNVVNGIGWTRHTSSKGNGSSTYADKQSEMLVRGGNKMLVLDEAAALGSSSSGKCAIRDFKSGGFKTIIFDKKNESSNAVLSNHGNYVLSCIDGVSENGNGILRFTLYNSDTLKKVNSFDYEGESENVSLSFMKVNEENNWAYLVLVDGGKMKHIRLSIPSGE